MDTASKIAEIEWRANYADNWKVAHKDIVVIQYGEEASVIYRDGQKPAYIFGPNREDNAEFLAHAKEDIKTLLAILQQQRQEILRLRA